jgi:hypothetical protein
MLLSRSEEIKENAAKSKIEQETNFEKMKRKDNKIA